MKFFTVLLVSFFVAFVLSSCSNVEQDYSPVSPEINKISNVPDLSAYNYLETFYQAKVESYGTSDDGSLAINCQSNNWPNHLRFAFVILEYNANLNSPHDVLVVVNNLESNIIYLSGYTDRNLSNVKVYYPLKGIIIPEPGLPDFTVMDEMKVGFWETNNKAIVVQTPDWKSTLTETFIEIQMKHQSVLVYASKPSAKEIILPMYGDQGVTGVNLYGLFQPSRVK
jgi:hypothetical protein